MTESAVAVVCLLVLIWAVLSRMLTRHDVTGPLLFVVAGYLLGNPDWGLLTIDVDTSIVHTLAELTLGLVLFTDASRVDVGRLRRAVRLPARLLLVGLPLTIGLGTVGAEVMFSEFGWGLALFVGAALAPTDAALSVQVIDDERIPRRLRLSLNVESGLNDGIATPVVTLAIAIAASALGVAGADAITVGEAAVELGLGIGIGVVVGGLAAWAINQSAARDLSSPKTRQIAALATAVGVFALAIGVEGNGFIAAFVAGMTFGYVLDRERVEDRRTGPAGGDAARRHGDDTTVLEVLPELGGELLALVVWFLFGSILIPLAFHVVEAGDLALMAGYAVLSLTVFRMLPVAVSLVGAGLRGRDVLILGWFGPRGLASVVFALLGAEQLGSDPNAQAAVAAIGVTVLASVVLHGATAGPVARRYPQDGQPATPDDGHVRMRPSGVHRWRR
ncbi:cation:proton antiporter [Gordonia sp. LSe1-13]|uniref:Cation:proton antiporter n=1 Tax=Gordonia sesuvii TaxID=3116777 RepID=A0ABU7MDA0_9ACTN|nr:cation:proton antiporter [Gordonia sp. LSe1-13]